MTIRILTGLFMLVAGTSLFAADAGQGCCAGRPQGTRGECILESDGGSACFSFETEMNHILLPAKVQGESFKLILDTGMPYDGVMLFAGPKADGLNLSYSGYAVVGGGDESCGSKPNLAQGATVAFPGLVLKDQVVMVVPPCGMPSAGIQAEGVIGLSLFERFTVALDYGARSVTFTRPDLFKYTGSGQVLPAPRNARGIPELKCTVEMEGGRRILIHPVVDTGASHALSLILGSADGIELPERSLEASLGRGLFGEIEGRVGRIPSLQIGTFKLNDLVASFRTESGPLQACAEREGNLGGGALRRFNVVFDYKNDRMILERGDHFADPFEFDMSGMELETTQEGTYRVRRVHADSPAAEAGVRAGDVVVRVDGRPAGEINAMDLKEFLKKEGREISFELVRGEAHETVKITLRRVI